MTTHASVSRWFIGAVFALTSLQACTLPAPEENTGQQRKQLAFSTEQPGPDGDRATEGGNDDRECPGKGGTATCTTCTARIHAATNELTLRMSADDAQRVREGWLVPRGDNSSRGSRLFESAASLPMSQNQVHATFPAPSWQGASLLRLTLVPGPRPSGTATDGGLEGYPEGCPPPTQDVPVDFEPEDGADDTEPPALPPGTNPRVNLPRCNPGEICTREP